MIGEEGKKMLKLKKVKLNKKKHTVQALVNKLKLTIMKKKNKNLKKNLNIQKLISLILSPIQHLRLDHREVVEAVVGTEVVEGVTIRMKEKAVKDKIIIAVVEVVADILIGITTTMVKEGLNIEEVIEGEAVEIITKHQMTQKHLEKREKSKWAGNEMIIIEIITTPIVEIIETIEVVIEIEIVIRNILINCRILMI